MLNSKDVDSPAGFKYDSLQQLCSSLGAKKPIKRLLIANNGLAAVKGIDSIRSWTYEHMGDSEAVQFIVMATPEDLKANAEFISMADQHIPVPGGPNSNNYANVDVIMQTALQNMCDAIYPGWGHASENPALPRECAKSKRVTFLGPSEDAMFALGDKIASTIVAQSNGVPTVPWSGDSIRLTPGTFDVDAQTYDKAYVTSPEECEEVCRRIGFPVMIKASEGGGGKGIRCCTNIKDVKNLFFAVSEEVKGCHIFVMRMLENVRHLEVQLLADNYGNCIAVRTRDCSVQRRHQKIVEEGPAFGVDPAIIQAMETAAIQLARAVNYSGLGTVEYMYDKETHGFYFLELNPRIQVEHPVSEMISGVNLPAALLCVGMGIRLDHIPEVRVFYGEEPYGTTPIDFTVRQSLPPKCHTIAVRVTAEDTDEGFRPTSGKVEEIAFKNSKECWGYFSVGSGGEIHQFADSQFGHIFSSGETREEARRGMVLALRNLVVRGEVRTSTPYVMELLETPAFRDCDVSTSWLDGLIAKKAADVPAHQRSIHSALIAASIYRNMRSMYEHKEKYISFLAAGHVPSTEYLSNFRTESYVNRSEKYTLSAGMASPNEYAISLNGSIVLVPFRVLKSGALQLTIGDKTLVAYVSEEPNSLRITIGGKVTNFSGDIDPTKIMATVPGRLVRYVIDNDGHVNEGDTFAEVEVMKMLLPLRASTTGTLHHRAVPGSTIAMGSQLAEITPDDPSKVARPTEIKDPWPTELLLARQYERPDGVTRARRAAESLWELVNGYHFKEMPIEERVRKAFADLASLSLSAVTLKAVHLSFLPAESFVESETHPLTPNEKYRVIIDAIVERYVGVEQGFDGKSRQEAIEAVRESLDNADAVYAVDFAHNQDCHHYVMRSVLGYLEGNTLLLKSLKETLAKIVTLKSFAYGSLLLQSRYLLRLCSLPSFTERKAQFAEALEKDSLRDLIASSFGYDLLCSIMFDRQMEHLVQICLELFVRREYFGESDIKNLDIFKEASNWYATYSFDPIMDADALLMGDEAVVKSPYLSTGSGVCVMLPDEQTLKATLASSFRDVVMQYADDVVIATVFVSVSRESSQSDVARMCYLLIEEDADVFRSFKKLETLFFVAHGMPEGPHFFSFRAEMNFHEDTLLRNVLPQSARRLELDRLSNYEVSMYPTPYKDVHVFKAAPKKAGATMLEHRMFARVAVTPHDMGMTPWTEATDVDAGHMLAKCLAALQAARDDSSVKYPDSNHVFVKMIELTFDVRTMQQLLASAASSYQETLANLGVGEVELAFHVKVPSGLIPMRVIASSPSGYGVTVHLYYESLENGRVQLHRAETSEDVDYSSTSRGSEFLVDMNPASPTSTVKGSPSMMRTMSKLEALREMLPSEKEQQPVASLPEPKEARHRADTLGPYPQLDTRQVKRLQARRAGTTYVHDWPAMLNLIVRKVWMKMCRARSLDASTIPQVPFHATELFIGEDGVTLSAQRHHAAQTCGMVVWMVEYAPPSYYDVEAQLAATRRVVVVANDITFQSGSFAVPEDRVFKAASVLARAQHLPFVYISANSGARLGLSNEVKSKFLVEFTGKSEIAYLYLTKADYEELTTKKSIRMEAEPLEVNGETRYVIKGVVGGPTEYLGVENLSGSGLVAGEMSKNYGEIPTISLVSGRSVGIGAYLNRLGRRVIQTNDSPLILTGAGALNRLLGKDVYMGNSQLGGKQIMVPNGVTHWCTRHDYASARVLLQWLDYVPAVAHPTRCSPRSLLWMSSDPVDRDVTFCPVPNTPYDPRFLVTGLLGQTGLFDRGSWMETLEGWARTVVAGRATLGGVPCGVVLVETRLTKKFDPADPADPTSTSSFLTQAGQVWFPDSARKTADALDDFHHERLPCFILANWRGFSGGMRDMFDEVLKFGASIVDNLRVYTAPVFIYIPPAGELRGGAWVVVDSVINHGGVVEMYCDPSARGGVLEASGVTEIKFRDNDVRDLIRRNRPDLAAMEPKAAREAENAMLPQYRDVAVRFADLHDTHVRMKATGVVRDVVPWKESRRHFYHKLQRKLKELAVANDLVEGGTAATLGDAVRAIQQRYAAAYPHGPAWGTDDRQHLQWLESVDGSWMDGEAAEAELGTAECAKEMQRLLRQHGSDAASMERVLAKLFENAAVAEAAKGAMESSFNFSVCSGEEE
ncbi:putative mitochondrial acetyl-CoA carboxylase [Leptomonas pyrrhocoris]|uniref:Putative mitochondrial acetyl-CoA carboxylase n=1 Tax=Leptomonas pyrrhocoris TaxID=157538 RepID=A0A0M9FRG9_LEPPY|nr:putative mitochondrial acetyl-CoA carboxylase [Leptomonas pyrrhocoris]KPA74560.1 putative mitochondrial acetyl-CoA carboxylase [Leptomonas pyrrhocoris]|eukprot:XP_015652999.1 putative mitochondrial acetyl-CoA carboxylase [Leptomonas pyrrhocoris]